MPDFDCIVIGLGGMGSAAAAELARRGARVLGLEQYEPVHARGSSHGQSRIIRQAYFEHPDYVPLLRRAYLRWRELGMSVGRRLFERTGLLLVGAPDGPVIAGARHAADVHQLPLRSITPSDFAREFPGFRLTEGAAALHEPEAGYLRVEDCVAAQLSEAKRHGATLLFGEPARAWAATTAGVEVETAGRRWSAARLIVCGGAWAGRLLADLGLPLEVRRRVQFWFGCRHELYAPEGGAPAFCYDRPEGFFYGFPALEPGVMKIAQHAGPSAWLNQPVLEPAAVRRELDPRDAPPVQAFIRTCLAGVLPEVLRHSVCLYTMTPDQHFLVDRHPACECVYFAAGFSGHGFKFCPVIGEALADLALSGQTCLPVDFLRLERLRTL